MSSTSRDLKLEERGNKLRPLRMNHQLLLALILATLSLHSSAFGTLLTSPAERVLLDNRRQNSELHPQTVQRVKAVQPNKTISLEGLVTRQKGPGSIWLNGQLLDKGAAGLSMPTHATGTTAVSLPSAQGRAWLKPGQIIRPDSGELRDAYQRQARPLDDKQVAPLDTESAPDNLPLMLDTH